TSFDIDRRGDLPADTEIASSLSPSASRRPGTATPESVWVLCTNRPRLDFTQSTDLVRAHEATVPQVRPPPHTGFGPCGRVRQAFAHQASSLSAGHVLTTRSGSSPSSSARWQP